MCVCVCVRDFCLTGRRQPSESTATELQEDVCCHTVRATLVCKPQPQPLLRLLLLPPLRRPTSSLRASIQLLSFQQQQRRHQQLQTAQLT